MVVLLTGCRSGFGLLAAVEAARRGHTVYAGLRDVSTADGLLEAAGDLPIRPVQLDVTDPVQREEVVARIEAEHGALDGLVNNAGIALGGPLEEVSEAGLRKVFEVNVFGAWALTTRALPAMRAQGRGCVIQVSSMAGRIALPGLGAYAASKFALSGMTESWRAELAPFGVQMVLLEPGPYKTDIFSRNRRVAETPADSPYRPFIERMEAKAEQWTHRAGDAQDVADTICDLLAHPSPPWRVPMGPTVHLRRALRWTLPDRGWEALVRAIVG